MSKRILLDLSFLDRDSMTGVWQFARTLLKVLRALDYEVDVLARESISKDISHLCRRKIAFGARSNITRVPLLNMKLSLISWRYDLVFLPNTFSPILPCRRFVAVIHDLAFLHERPTGYLQRTYLLASLFIARFRAKHLITVSEQSKRDIESATHRLTRGCPISIVHNVVTEDTKPPGTTRIEDGTFRLLFMGTNCLAKGAKRFIEVINEIRKIKSDIAIHGHMIGPVGDFDPESYARQIGVQNFITVHGFVGEENKIQIINQCDFLIFLSLVEGFGIPILEALNHQVVPVVPDIPLNRQLFPFGPIFVSPDNMVADTVHAIISYEKVPRAQWLHPQAQQVTSWYTVANFQKQLQSVLGMSLDNSAMNQSIN